MEDLIHQVARALHEERITRGMAAFAARQEASRQPGARARHRPHWSGFRRVAPGTVVPPLLR